MKGLRLFLPTILIAVLLPCSAAAREKATLGDNSALRYWSAFSQLQDAAIPDSQVKELNAILDGTAPYDDSKYKDLVEKNKLALDLMARGAAFAQCDWGLDYELGPDTPVDYARKAAPLARLNVLYAFHLQIIGDKEGEVDAVVAGLRFSRDIANGGSLFATLVAEDSLIKHFRAIAFAIHADALSASQRSTLRKAIAGLAPLDWQSAIKLEIEALSGLPWPSTIPSTRFAQAYADALNNPSALPKLQEFIASLPPQVKDAIPNPKRVLEEKQDLAEKLQEMRAKLQ
jgi:hypothetical protein